MKPRIGDGAAVALCIVIALIAQAADTSLPSTGSWRLNNWGAATGRVHIELTRASLTSRWVEGRDYPIDELKGLSRDQLSSMHSNVRFEIVRDAGNIVCEGSVVAGLGGGTFAFSPNGAFVTEMRKLGFNDLDEGKLFSMAVSDVSLVFARQVLKLGMRDVTSTDLIRMRERNITPEYIAETRSYGYDYTATDLIRLKDHGVNGQFLHDLKKAGYDLRADEVARLRDHGVNSEYVRDLAGGGAARLTAEELVRLHDHGVAADFVTDLQRAGYSVGPDDVIRLHDHGVSSNYVTSLAFRPDDLIRLHDNGVSAEFPKQLKAAGYGDVAVHEIIRMWQNGVNGDYIARLQASGMKGLTPEQIIKLRQHGID